VDKANGDRARVAPARRDRLARRRAAGALLRLSLLERPSRSDLAARLLGRTDPSLLLDLARYHGVAGMVYEAVRDEPGAPAELLTGLEKHHLAAVQWHLHGLWQLARLGGALDGAGVRWVVVKGPVLVDTLYGALGRRQYKDLDILVHPAEFASTVTALEAHGALLLDRNWSLLRRERRAQVHFALASGLDLDLHWDLVNVQRRHMAMDTAAIIERRTFIDLGGLRVPTLDQADTVIHLAVHAALSGGDKLMWVKDIERAVAVRPPDWDQVVARARAWHVAGSVGLMLDRARRILAADIPMGVPEMLVGRNSMQIARAIDRLDRLEASSGAPTPGRVLARTIGHGVADGAMVMAQRFIRHFDPREPARSDPFAPAGDYRDRQAYLAAVDELGNRGR
jgi:hypothetical protein